MGRSGLEQAALPVMRRNRRFEGHTDLVSHIPFDPSQAVAPAGEPVKYRSDEAGAFGNGRTREGGILRTMGARSDGAKIDPNSTASSPRVLQSQERVQLENSLKTAVEIRTVTSDGCADSEQVNVADIWIPSDSTIDDVSGPSGRWPVQTSQNQQQNNKIGGKLTSVDRRRASTESDTSSAASQAGDVSEGRGGDSSHGKTSDQAGEMLKDDSLQGIESPWTGSATSPISGQCSFEAAWESLLELTTIEPWYGPNNS